MQRGLFIVFEGNNGAGKTTIINELIKKLNNNSDFVDIKNKRKIYNWNVYKFPNLNNEIKTTFSQKQKASGINYIKIVIIILD